MNMEDLKLDPSLDLIANGLKKGFADHKSVQIGKRYAPADRFKSMHIWYGAARKCVELEADPEDFLQAAFQQCSIPGGPYPQNLASRAMDRWYKEYKWLLAADYGELPPGETVYGLRRKRLIQEAFLVAWQMSRRGGKTLSSVLLDDYGMSLALYPAFVRVLLLPKDPAVMAKWGSLARAEIMSNPQLLKFLLSSTFDVSWL